MKVTDTVFPDVKLIEPTVFKDDRGWFMETFQAQRYKAALGIDVDFVQDNMSFSKKGVLRGLHFQYPNPQGKLVMVLEGSVYDVVVDVRIGSKTFGKWYGVELTSDPPKQLWVPEGFAHGFLVTSVGASVLYKCTRFYDPRAEQTLVWNDSSVGVIWPSNPSVVSQKDLGGKALRDLVA